MTEETRAELYKNLWRIHGRQADRIRIALSPADRSDSIRRSALRFAAKRRMAIECWTVQRTFHVVRVA